MESGDDYEYDNQVDEGRVQELEDKVSSLTKENEVLKAQFSQAIQLSDSLKSITAKNDELSQKIRVLTLENEDLNHRIEILNKKLQESQQKLEEERKTHEEQRSNDQKDIGSEMDRIKADLSQTIDRLSKNLEEATNKKDSLESEMKLLKAKNEKLIAAANYSLSSDFSTLDDLISYYEQQTVEEPAPANAAKKASSSPVKSPSKSPTKSPVQHQQQPSEDVSRMKSKLKSMQAKNKQLMETCVNLEDQLNAAQRKLKDQESKHTTQIQQYENKIKIIQDESNLTQADQKHQITLLENKVENLKSEVAKSRTALHDSTVINIPNDSPMIKSPQKAQPTPKRTPVTTRSVSVAQEEPTIASRFSTRTDNGNTLAYDHLSSKNSELATELQAVNAKKDELQKKLAEANEARQALELNVSKQKVALDTLTTVHGETVAELETVRKTLNTLSPLKERAPSQNKETAKFQKKIAHLEKTIEEQREQISQAINESTASKSELARLSSRANQLEQEVQRCDAQIHKLTADLTDAEHRYETKPTVTEDDLLPASAWRFAGFDQELSEQVANIGANEALQPQSKLRAVFKTIADFYNAVVDESDAAAFEANEGFATFRKAVDTFLVDLTIAYSGDAHNLDEFLVDNGQSIVKSVSELKRSFDELRRKNNTLEQNMLLFKDIFGGEETEDVTEAFSAIKQTLDTRAQNLESRNRRVRELKQSLDSLQKKSSQEKSQLIDELDDANRKIDEIGAQLSQTQSELASVKRRNQELTQLLREAREHNDNLQNTMMAEQENAAQSAADEITRLDQSLRAEIKAAEERISMTESELEDATAEIEKLKAVIVAQKESMNEFQAKGNQEKDNMKEIFSQEKQRMEDEKAQLIESYESAIDHLKEQAENSRNTIEKLTNDVNDLDAKLKETQKLLSKTRREKKNLIEEIRITKEQCDREIKLAESKHISEMMEIEADCNSRIGKQQEKCDAEKNQLILFAANELKAYIAAGEGGISERAFKGCIQKAKAELDRLTKSDTAVRKMTKAADRQTTEDAVAQILLEK